MSDDPEREPQADDEIPRQTFWQAMPKRSLSRILMLLAIFAGIIYLRQRAGAIAGCMSDAFRAPPPSGSGVKVKATVIVPPARTGNLP
jgi:hypothetical protein